MTRLWVLLVTVVTCMLVCPEVVQAAGKSKTASFPVRSYFVFGDGTVDTGNNNYLTGNVPKANIAPYGMTYFKKPTGRFTNGRVLGDFLAQALNLPLASPYQTNYTILNETKGMNFASGGSGILDGSSPGTTAEPLSVQLSQFEQVAGDINYFVDFSTATTVLQDAIYLISSGSVDLSTYFLNSKYQAAAGPLPKFLKDSTNAYHSAITRLYTQGARKVVVLGVGPLQKAPALEALLATLSHTKAQHLAKSIDGAVQSLNAALSNLVTTLPKDTVNFSNLTMAFGDTYKAENAFITYPAKFGLSDVKNACCGGGTFGAKVQCGARGYKLCKRVDRSFFWDNLHPTEAVIKEKFNLFWNCSPGYIKPISIMALAKLPIPH